MKKKQKIRFFVRLICILSLFYNSLSIHLYLAIHIDLYCVQVFLSRSCYLHLFIRMCSYRTVCLFKYLSVCLFIFSSIYLSVCLFVYLSIFPSIYLYIYLTIHPTIHPSIYLSFYPSISLYINLSLFHFAIYLYLLSNSSTVSISYTFSIQPQHFKDSHSLSTSSAHCTFLPLPCCLISVCLVPHFAKVCLVFLLIRSATKELISVLSLSLSLSVSVSLPVAHYSHTPSDCQ